MRKCAQEIGDEGIVRAATCEWVTDSNIKTERAKTVIIWRFTVVQVGALFDWSASCSDACSCYNNCGIELHQQLTGVCSCCGCAVCCTYEAPSPCFTQSESYRLLCCLAYAVCTYIQLIASQVCHFRSACRKT
jgi:hypothetical protein